MFKHIFIALLCVLVVFFGTGLANAHTLGVDRAEMVESEPGTYRLTSKVPRRIATAILTPILPDQCTFAGNPNGERGTYSVTFTFTCTPHLSSEHKIVLPWKREGALLKIRWLGQEPVTRLAKRDGDTIEISLDEWLVGSGSALRAAKRYTVLGIEHILEGIDHLFFVLALLFVVNGSWKLVKSVTAYTVAHSITLAAATLGFVNLPSAPVEAAIALSIVFLASEIIWKSRGRNSLTFKAPRVVAFAFGLLHGLGFAGALSEIGLPPAEIPIALLIFSIGVEIGQLMFVAAALSVGWLIYRVKLTEARLNLLRLVTVYGIGTISMFWMIERTAQVFL